MSIIIAAKVPETNDVVFGSDGRLNYEGGVCIQQPIAKYTHYDWGDVIGFTGVVEHEALVREHYANTTDLLQALRLAHQELNQGNRPHEGLELEILWWYKDLFLVGGDRGVVGPYEYVAAGKPTGVALGVMDTLWRRMRTRNTGTIRQAIRTALGACAKYDTSCGPPFFVDVY